MASFPGPGQVWNASLSFEKGKEGIMVAGVIQDSPADKSGFRPGDRITHYNGKSVNARIPEDLPLFNQMAYSLKPGKEITVKGYRNDEKKSWQLTPQLRESAFQKRKN